jgi:hypothetical protein
MPPVAAAIGTAATAVGASLGVAVGAPLAGTGFLASLGAGTFFAQAFTQIAAGVALSAISRALAPSPGTAVAGVKAKVQFGDDAPASIILGRHATAGDMVYANSCGDRNEYACLVVELSDVPARLRRVMVNGEWGTLGTTPDPDRGHPVLEYRSDGKDYLWVRFYDGTPPPPTAIWSPPSATIRTQAGVALAVVGGPHLLAARAGSGLIALPLTAAFAAFRV